VKISWKTIPHIKQRYPTVGDYRLGHGKWKIRTSQMKDSRHERLVFLHELIELNLVIEADIKIKDIDSFDITYESTRHSGTAPCGCRHLNEPGDDEHAPYHEAHQVATKCERLIAKALGVEWADYERAVEELMPPSDKLTTPMDT